MPRSLANAKTKFTILTEEPVDWRNPTAAELEAGIDASPRILESDFNFGATDSEKVAEKALSEENNANAISSGNYQCAFTAFREFNATTGAPDPTGDVVHDAVKVKGTELWCYGRRIGVKSSVAWLAAQEIYLAAHVITDNPQPPGDLGGYIKERIPCEVQEAEPFTAVAGP